MRARLVAASVVAAAVAAPANGLPRDQVTDVRGDARGGLAHSDILSARWSTTGKGTTKSLVATMTLAAPARSDVPFVYELKSKVRGCGTVWFQYTPGTVADATARLNQPAINDGDVGYRVWLECGSGQAGPKQSSLIYKEVTFTAKGSTISWSVPLSALPHEVGIGRCSRSSARSRTRASRRSARRSSRSRSSRSTPAGATASGSCASALPTAPARRPA